MDRTKIRNIAACAVAGTVMSGMLRTHAVGAAEISSGFIVYNGNSLGTGTERNPVPVWNGWAGPDKYYLFAAKRLETATPVQSVQDLNRYNVELYGRSLSGPYINLLRAKPDMANGFRRGVLPNPNAPQEQRPSVPIISLPKVSSERGWHLSQTDKNAIVFAGELAAFWGLLFAIERIKKLKH